MVNFSWSWGTFAGVALMPGNITVVSAVKSASGTLQTQGASHRTRGSSLCSSNTCDYVTCSSVRLYTSSQRHNLVTAMMQGCCQDLQKFCCYRVSWIVQSFLYSSKGKGDQGKTVNAEFRMWLKNSKTLKREKKPRTLKRALKLLQFEGLKYRKSEIKVRESSVSELKGIRGCC